MSRTDWVNFETYFQDELADEENTVDEILDMYGWKKTIKCPWCGKRFSIFEARFDTDYDRAYCVECAEADPDEK